MGAAMTSIPPAVLNGSYHRSATLTFDPVAGDIEEVDRIFAATLAQYRSPFAPLVSHLKHYRGKRLRPALLLLCAKACGKLSPHHHTLAAAVEMIHTATLVHDDVLDEAEVRRHVSTVNAARGNKVSILLGDMLFTHAFHLTSKVDGRACGIIGEATNRVCAGELRQVCERGNLDLAEADYFAIIDGKTAALTECCGRLGALYAGATDEVAARLASFGRNLGLAFQIADDVLDLVGDEPTAGKTLGTDLEQQKLTLPLIHCLKTLPRAEADDLISAIRVHGPQSRERITVALTGTNAITHARRVAAEHARAAREELACLPRSECRSILETMTEWSVHRVK